MFFFAENDSEQCTCTYLVALCLYAFTVTDFPMSL